MSEPAVSVRCRDGRQGLPDCPLQRCAGAGLGGPHAGLARRPGVRDGREIRRVRRQGEPLGPAPLHALTAGGRFMRAQVIHHDKSTRAQRRAQDLRRGRVQALGSRGPRARHDGLEAVQATGCQRGQVGAIVLWHGPDAPRAARRAPAPTRQRQGDARRVAACAALESARLDQWLVACPRVLDRLGVARRRGERCF